MRDIVAPGTGRSACCSWMTAAAVAVTRPPPRRSRPARGRSSRLAAFACQAARKDKGQDVKIVELSDWVALNEVVNSGDVDANLFQHATYLALQNKQRRGFNLVRVDRVGVIAPVGLFSKEDQDARRDQVRRQRRRFRTSRSTARVV